MGDAPLVEVRLAGAPTPQHTPASRLTYQIACPTLQRDRHRQRRLFVWCLFSPSAPVSVGGHWRRGFDPPPYPKIDVRSGRIGASQIYFRNDRAIPGKSRVPRKFVGKNRIRDQLLALSFNGPFAKLNNSVIRGTNTVSRTFTRNDVMEVLMRTYMLAIAAALFAIPTAAFSESGHHRYYNRYEGLYDRYESGRCKELRAVCAHKEELGIGNCRRFRELCD